MYRLTLVTFAVCSSFVGWLGSSRAADQVQTVLDKAIQAHGGAEKLAKIRAVKIQSRGSGLGLVSYKFDNSKSDENDALPYTKETSYQFPDKFKEDMSMEITGGIRLRTVEVLKQGKGKNYIFSSLANGSNDVQGRMLAELKERLHRKQVAWLIAVKNKGYTLLLLKEDQGQEKPTVGIRVQAKGFRDIDLFFDKQTGLLAKMRYRKMNEATDKECTEEEVVTEYQKVNGIAVPKKIELHRDGELVREEEFVKVKLTDSLKENVFTKP